ncbi:MAG: helix-turn-helix domain-containing protein [SAR324 cluster bacterium]|nr:helix-turn-helix domain-containing protein [SAR324 cluster bacterium]
MRLDYKPLFVKAYQMDLNLTTLAKESGISRGHLSRVKNGSENLSVDHLLRLAQVLLIEYNKIGELFHVVEEPQTPSKKKIEETASAHRAEDQMRRRAEDQMRRRMSDRRGYRTDALV